MADIRPLLKTICSGLKVPTTMAIAERLYEYAKALPVCKIFFNIDPLNIT
jgi:hypothetical protein